MNGSWENFRTVRNGPPIESGCTITFTRERAVGLLVGVTGQVDLGEALVVEEWAQLVDHELVHLLAHLLERVLPLRGVGFGHRAAGAGGWGCCVWVILPLSYFRRLPF